MTKILPLLFLFLFFSILKLNAQTQLTDFSYMAGNKSSSPSEFVKFNNFIVFTALTEHEGRELWISDGTSTNTRLLKDIYPGQDYGIPYLFKQSAVVLGDQLFFIANDGKNGNQIWVTKGTEESTKRVTSLSGFNASKLTLANNSIFFIILNNDLLQVWKTDGTSNGTVLVKKNLSTSHEPSYEGAADNLFFFTFKPVGTNKSRVWRSDGTETGTFPITEELDGNGAGSGGTSGLSQYIEFKNELYFVVRSHSTFSYPTSVGIVKTDGTVKNTIPVKAVHEGSTRLIDFADVIEANNKLYFSFFEVDYNRLFIWESDGTETGTKKIYDEAGSKFFMPSSLSSDGKHLLFTGKSNTDKTALLKLSLDNYKLEELKELPLDAANLNSDLSNDNVYHITHLGGSNFVIFEPYYSESAGWISDLTPPGTVQLDVLKKTREAIVFNKNTYFAGFSKLDGNELWQSDFTFDLPQQILNINKSGYGLDYASTGILDNKVLFSANDGKVGEELWVYNPSTHQKSLIKDINTGERSSYPSNFVHLNEYIYFTAYAADFSRNLWRTDGTREGTIQLNNLDGSSEYSYVANLTKGKNEVYFTTYLNNNSILSVSDGINTRKIKDSYSTNITTAGEYTYFVINRNELWRSDGTEEGTVKVKSLGEIKNLTAVSNKVYFSGSEEYQGEFELWQSNGTPTGTTMIKNIEEGYSSNPEQLVNFNGQLVFTAFSKEFGREFWKSDGTAEGTIQILDINPGLEGSTGYSFNRINSYATINGFLYFVANDGTHGTELWRTDGTGTGTVLVKDIHEGEEGSFPENFAVNKNKVYFSAYSPTSGTEIWTTEGTTATTKQLFDLNTGLAGSTPNNFTFIDDELFFVAEKDNSGQQLWQYKQDNVTGISDPFASETFIVYPNPTEGYLFIKKGNQQIKALKLYNLQGQEFKIDQDKSGKMYVGNLPGGIYFLKAEIDNKIMVQKFIKK